jgi:ribonuclease-3
MSGDLDALSERIGYRFVDQSLLERALAHRSWCAETPGTSSNERLEFLGDAVLEMVITDALYLRYPERSEGELAKIRAAVVNARACARAAREKGLGEHMLLGRGEVSTGGHDKTSILADAMEAIFGAVYLGCGLAEASRVILGLFDDRIHEAADLGVGLDWKTSLQELTAALGLGVPEYQIVGTGPDHNRSFTAQIRLDTGTYGQGAGRTKKEAEMEAAQTAYREITLQHGDGAVGA